MKRSSEWQKTFAYDKVPVPEVGEEYNYFSNLSYNPNSLFIARVEKIIPLKEAYKMEVDCINFNVSEYMRKHHPSLIKDTLYNVFYRYKRCKGRRFIYRYPDVFVEISVPKISDHNLFATRGLHQNFYVFPVVSLKDYGCLDLNEDYLYKCLQYCKVRRLPYKDIVYKTYE